MTRALVALAFFVSGASSLMLEVVWSKALGRVLGTTLEAITTVVAAYMFGLALGAGWAGRSTRLTAHPVRAYGLLEAGIGLFALVSLPLVAALDGPLGVAYRAFGGESAGFAAARFLAAFALLLVPTTLMGATLPVLVAWGAKRADLSRVLGTLYALNTAGAVAGTLLAGFVLLPAVGLSRTALFAGLVSLAVGALMVLAARKAPAKDAPAQASARAAAAPETAREGGDRGARFILVLFALSGVVSLSSQIAWSRLAANLIGSSVYSFTLVLGTFLVGIALGSALLVVVLGKRAPSWRLFALLQWIAAAGIVYASVRLADAPWRLLETMADAGGQIGSLWLREAMLLAGVMLPACLAFGALFPVAVRLSAFAGDAPARTAGRAYGWNTLGTVTGSLLTGFVLVQTLGTRWTLLGAALLAVLLGVAAWIRAPKSARGPAFAWGVPLAMLALMAFGLLRLPSWDRGLFAMGVYRPSILASAEAKDPAKARRMLLESMAGEEMVWLKEGRQATVTVHRLRADTATVALRVNGKTDASTGLDMATQVLSAQLPMLWAGENPRVLIVGYGSGVTVGSVLTHDPARVDMAEIEPAVLEADRWFAHANGRPRENPLLHAHVEDGRTFLSKRAEQFDVIVSEPSNPWISGVNNLFTVDFYRLVRSRLAEGGVFCQWAQFYELSSETLASVLRSIAEVFPEAEVFIANNDLLLVAPKDGRPLDLARAAERMKRPKIAHDLARVGVHSTGDLVAYHRTSLAALVALLPEAPLNTDDRPVVEYRAPRDLYRVRVGESPLPASALEADRASTDLARWTRGGAEGLIGDVAIAREREGRWDQAKTALDANDLATARLQLDALLATSPGFAPALIERGRIAIQDGELLKARELFERSLVSASADEAYQAHCHLGMIDLRAGRPAEALAAFERATRARPEVAGAYVFRARALLALDRPDEAFAVLGEGGRTVTDRAAIDAARAALGAPARP